MNQEQNKKSFLYSLFGYERSTSKSRTVLVILIHLAGWCLLFFLPALLYPVRITTKSFIYREIVDKAVLVGLFYLNYYLLIPRLIVRRKYVQYFAMVVCLFIFYFSQQFYYRHEFFRTGRLPGTGMQLVIQSIPSTRPPSASTALERDSFRRRPFREGFQRIPGENAGMGEPPFPEDFLIFGIPRGLFFASLNQAFSSFSLIILLGGFIRLTYSFIRNQHEKKALENANLNAEVNFLKSQINPHFLFNTLNSIYSQAHARSDNTEFSILKLSELLRYVLYDSGEDRVDLAKDIGYINNYIDLQRLRLSPRVKLFYTVRGDSAAGNTIAPLLLISFIENAFKHGISYTHPSSIEIDIHIFEKTLTLMVSNPVLERDSFGPGGVGMKNVSRRLELLYPNQHSLVINRDDQRYIVNLKLELTHA